jgi:glycosyltransferase involved in cell wall biosynthesis
MVDAAGSSALRVAHLINRYPSVSHTFIRREIAELEANGADVLRISIRPEPREALEDERDIAELERTFVLLRGGLAALARDAAALCWRAPGVWGRGLFEALSLGWQSDRGVLRHVAYFFEACRLKRHLDASRAAHLHAHFGTNSTAVAMLCRSLGGPPFSFTAHGTESFDHPALIKLGRKIAAADFAVAVCDYGRAQLMRCTRSEDWPKIQVVRCGLDSSFFVDPIPVPGRPRLVCVARLSAEKGHLLLLDAARELAAEGIDFEITLVGDGNLRETIRARVAALGLAGRVRLAGALSGDDVRKEILDARALVLPSLAEGLPVVLMEALALGRPVIATSVGGIPELIESGIDGWLVPPASPGALAAAMREALHAPPERLDEMGSRGRARVRERHDARVEARKLLALMRVAPLARTAD